LLPPAPRRENDKRDKKTFLEIDDGIMSATQTAMLEDTILQYTMRQRSVYTHDQFFHMTSHQSLRQEHQFPVHTNAPNWNNIIYGQIHSKFQSHHKLPEELIHNKMLA